MRQCDTCFVSHNTDRNFRSVRTTKSLWSCEVSGWIAEKYTQSHQFRPFLNVLSSSTLQLILVTYWWTLLKLFIRLTVFDMTIAFSWRWIQFCHQYQFRWFWQHMCGPRGFIHIFLSFSESVSLLFKRQTGGIRFWSSLFLSSLFFDTLPTILMLRENYLSHAYFLTTNFRSNHFLLIPKTLTLYAFNLQ